MNNSHVMGLLAGVFNAALTDINAFMKAESNSKFDWPLAIIRWIVGGLIGFLVGYSDAPWVPLATSILSTISVDLTAWKASGEKFSWAIFWRRVGGAIITGVIATGAFVNMGLIPPTDVMLPVDSVVR